ncbi:ABC transporter substrate-binding protein [soil metagenome]
MRVRLPFVATVLAVAVVASVSGCAQGDSDPTPIVVGTNYDIALDPADGTGLGALDLRDQLYPKLLTTVDGLEFETDLAAKADFDEADGTLYTVTIPSGLTFANGDDLTSSDVRFSLERYADLNFEGPAADLLSGIESIENPDPLTIVFHLVTANDATFPAALAGPAGYILDEQVFSADSLTGDDVIIAGAPFAGPSTLEPVERKPLDIHVVPFDDYAGKRASLGDDAIDIVRYDDPTSLVSDLRSGKVDVAFGPIPSADSAVIGDGDKVTTTFAPIPRVQLLVFDLAAMPFGTATPEANPTQALAVRQAIASVLDRDAVVSDTGEAFSAATGYLPADVGGASDDALDAYGDGRGGPDLDAAELALTTAGVATPVAIDIHSTTAFGSNTADAFAELMKQLDDSGLFTVSLKAGDASLADYLTGVTSASFPAYQWVPTDPGVDAADDLQFYATGGPLDNGFTAATVDDLLTKQSLEADPAARAELLKQVQAALAVPLPAIPLLQNNRSVYSSNAISGVEISDSGAFDLAALRHG